MPPPLALAVAWASYFAVPPPLALALALAYTDSHVVRMFSAPSNLVEYLYEDQKTVFQETGTTFYYLVSISLLYFFFLTENGFFTFIRFRASEIVSMMAPAF